MKFLPPLGVLVLLLLGGCATSLDNLIDQRTACLAQENCTDELHREINRREANIFRRKEIKEAWKQETWCPPGHVFYCADDWCSSRNQYRMPERRYSMTSGCVRRDDLRRIFGDRY